MREILKLVFFLPYSIVRGTYYLGYLEMRLLLSIERKKGGDVPLPDPAGTVIEYTVII